MKFRHAAVLVLVGWVLWLHASLDPEDHEEWSGTFKTKAQCETALSREQTHWLDANQGQRMPAWVRGLYGCCQEESARYRCVPEKHLSHFGPGWSPAN